MPVGLFSCQESAQAKIPIVNATVESIQEVISNKNLEYFCFLLYNTYKGSSPLGNNTGNMPI